MKKYKYYIKYYKYNYIIIHRMGTFTAIKKTNNCK